MASAAKKLPGLKLALPLLGPVAVGSLGYAAYRVDWVTLLKNFATGPGRTSRIALLCFVLFNWKSMPFVWTYRVFYAVIYHWVLRPAPVLGPRALFKPIVTPARTSLLEIDYNLHKSNSTYFADLDIGRTHLICYLCRASVEEVSRNTRTGIVLDPATGQPARGAFGIMLGAVECSFAREVPLLGGYELWSRVLSWDRKWVYVATYFVPKGAAKPTSWLDARCSRTRTRGPGDAAGGWDKKIHATAVSKYVFKLGRYTVHPAYMLGGSAGLLPERPGGWMSGEEQLGDLSEDLSDIDLDDAEGEWDWRRVEAHRRKGMELAAQFNALDQVKDSFDGGSNGAIGRFSIG